MQETDIPNDSAQAVSNANQSLPGKSLNHRPLDFTIGLKIYRARRLVTNDDPGVLDQNSCECKELPLAKRKVQTLVIDRAVELNAISVFRPFRVHQTRPPERIPELEIFMPIVRI